MLKPVGVLACMATVLVKELLNEAKEAWDLINIYWGYGVVNYCLIWVSDDFFEKWFILGDDSLLDDSAIGLSAIVVLGLLFGEAVWGLFGGVWVYVVVGL